SVNVPPTSMPTSGRKSASVMDRVVDLWEVEYHQGIAAKLYHANHSAQCSVPYCLLKTLAHPPGNEAPMKRITNAWLTSWNYQACFACLRLHPPSDLGESHQRFAAARGDTL